MTTEQQEKLNELVRTYDGCCQDAFYSEILLPKTDEDRKHNKELSNQINEAEVALKKYRDTLEWIH